jgi:hypothetical protein
VSRVIGVGDELDGVRCEDKQQMIMDIIRMTEARSLPLEEDWSARQQQKRRAATPPSTR